MEFSYKISMLDVTLGSDLSWNDQTTASKAETCKLGLLFRSRRYFTPSQLLTLYKAQIRPCLEYGSHLWRGASNHSLATLDAIQKRAIKLIGDPDLTNSTPWLTVEPFLPFLCTIDTIMVFVQSRWNQLFPLKPSLRETRGFRALSNWIKIEPSLSPTLLSLWPPKHWHLLPATVFPVTYNLQLFKTHIPSTPTQTIKSPLLLFTVGGCTSLM